MNVFNPLGLFSFKRVGNGLHPKPQHRVMLLFVPIMFTFSHLEAQQAARRFPRCTQHMLCYSEHRIAAADRDPSVFWWRLQQPEQNGPPAHPPSQAQAAAQEGASFCLNNPGRKGRKSLEGFRQIQCWGDTAEPGEFCSVPWHWQVPGAHRAEQGFPCSCLAWSLGLLWGSFSWSWDLCEYMGLLLSKERAGGLCQQGESWEAGGDAVKWVGC